MKISTLNVCNFAATTVTFYGYLRPACCILVFFLFSLVFPFRLTHIKSLGTQVLLQVSPSPYFCGIILYYFYELLWTTLKGYSYEHVISYFWPLWYFPYCKNKHRLNTQVSCLLHIIFLSIKAKHDCSWSSSTEMVVILQSLCVLVCERNLCCSGVSGCL